MQNVSVHFASAGGSSFIGSNSTVQNKASKRDCNMITHWKPLHFALHPQGQKDDVFDMTSRQMFTMFAVAIIKHYPHLRGICLNNVNDRSDIAVSDGQQTLPKAGEWP